MRHEKMTSRLQNALSDAQSLAMGKDHAAVEPVHLLAVLVDPKGASMLPQLVRAGARAEELGTRVSDSLDSLPTLKNPTGEISPGPGCIRVLNLADRGSRAARVLRGARPARPPV